MISFFLLTFLTLNRCATIDLFTSSFSQHGEGTYYGGNDKGGHCSIYPLPNWAKSITRVAINNRQYGNSETCGMCVEITGNGRGSGGNPITGKFIAVVNDECPECAPGDIDLGIKGDGRWDISWRAVDCPVGGQKINYMFQGSHKYYVKLQVRGGRVPHKLVEFKTKNGQWAMGKRTKDNFWTCIGCNLYPISGSVDVRITSITGEKIVDTVARVAGNLQQVSGKGKQFRGVSGGSNPPSNPPSRPPSNPPSNPPSRPPSRPPSQPPSGGSCSGVRYGSKSNNPWFFAVFAPSNANLKASCPGVGKFSCEYASGWKRWKCNPPKPCEGQRTVYVSGKACRLNSRNANAEEGSAIEETQHDFEDQVNQMNQVPAFAIGLLVLGCIIVVSLIVVLVLAIRK